MPILTCYNAMPFGFSVIKTEEKIVDWEPGL